VRTFVDTRLYKSGNMPYMIDIYIGSDNGSRRINRGYLSRVRKWATNSFPDGYTLMKAQGCYGQITEESILINVLSDRDEYMRDKVRALKQELRQDAILVVKAQVDFEFV